MLLAVDIGNTHTVLGLYERSTLAAHFRLSSVPTRTEDEAFVTFSFLCGQKSLDLKQIGGAILSSVVPEITPIYVRMIRQHLGLEPIQVNARMDCGLKILYENPDAVGADRVCNAVAGYFKYGGPIVIVDFGTATTFDCVSEEGEYLGGLIMPGIETASIDLHRRAAKLPKVELTFPERLIATNTADSLRAGIMYGVVESVDGILRRLRRELGANTRMIGTGGLAHTIVQRSEMLREIEPHMVLEGLRLIHERLENRKE